MRPAFAKAREALVICLAHVMNRMVQVEGGSKWAAGAIVRIHAAVGLYNRPLTAAVV
jgi:hypothetical protein